MDGGIGELPRLADHLQLDQLLLRFQQLLAGMKLGKLLAERRQIRHRQLMMTATGLRLEGIAQEQLQPVQSDLGIARQQAAHVVGPGWRLCQREKTLQQIPAGTILLLFDIAQHPQRRPLTDPYLASVA